MRLVFGLMALSPFTLGACSPLGTPYVDDYNARIISQTRPFVAELNASSATALTGTPVESSATMSGTFYTTTTGVPDVDAIAGKIDMTANFATSTVTGRMSDFVEVHSTTDDTLAGIDMYGRVDLTGTIDITSSSRDDIVATGTGNMRTTDGTTYSTSASLSGDLYRRPGTELGAVGSLSLSADAGGATASANGVFYVTE